MTIEIFLSLLAAAIQSGTPVLYATLGEIFTERAGILNLGVEGMMMVGAFAAFLTAKITGSPLLGFLGGWSVCRYVCRHSRYYMPWFFG